MSTIDKITVQWAKGEREFSREVHGDNFLDIAEEFASNNKGVLVDDEENVENL